MSGSGAGFPCLTDFKNLLVGDGCPEFPRLEWVPEAVVLDSSGVPGAMIMYFDSVVISCLLVSMHGFFFGFANYCKPAIRRQAHLTIYILHI